MTENRHHLKKLTDLYERMVGILRHREFSIHPADTPTPIDFYLFVESDKFSFTKLSSFNGRIAVAGYYLGEVTVTNPRFSLKDNTDNTIILKSYRYMVEIIKRGD